MNRSIGFSWQLLFRTEDGLFDALGSSSIVKLEDPPSYFNRISAQDPGLYHPIDVGFTNLFHLRLREALLDRLERPVQEKKFPYTVFLKSFGQECRVGVTCQLFLPNLMLLKITCYDSFVLDDKTAFHKRSFDSHPDLIFITQQCMDITQAALCSGKAFKRIDVKSIIKVHYDVSDNSFLDVDEIFLPAFLINDRDYHETNKYVFDRVMKRNKKHNGKSERSKLILINKQGYLAVTNANSIADRQVAQQIRKREHMFELGCVLRQLYQGYPAARQRYQWEMDYLFFATRPYIQQPGLIFDSSFGNTLAWKVIMKAFKLREALSYANRLDEQTIRTLTYFFDRHSDARYADRAFWKRVRAIAN